MADAALSPLAAGLRRHDRDRYQTALFAPAGERDALFALYAFNYEIARVREVTHEPILGRIRLQWWRDALDEIYRRAPPRRHEVAEALAPAIATHRLTRAHFEALIAAREMDFAEEPPESLAALESYAERSSASLVLLALEALGARDPASRAAGRAVGKAYALAGLLAAVPFHAAMRRVYLPQDLIRRHALDLERTLLDLKSAPALKAVSRDIAAAARAQLDAARAARARVPRAALPALLPAVLAAQRLRRLRHLDHDVLDPRWRRIDTLQSLRLSWAVLRRRY